MLSKLRQEDRLIGEVTEPLAFPIHYALTLDRQGQLLVLCYLQSREHSFAFWTKERGLYPTAFEPFNSLSTNGCLPPICQFCEQVHAAWLAGSQTPDGGDGGDRTSAPANARADEAAR